MKSQYGWILPTVLLFLSFSSLAGGYFDIWWHVRGKVETFFSLPHLVIYSSIFLGGIITLSTVIVHLYRLSSFIPAAIPHVKGLALIGTGKLFELSAGVMDGLYHEWVGFDVTLWSPPHLLVIFGGVIVALGIVELYMSMTSGTWRNFGVILALGLAVTNFQFAMTEYDIRAWNYGLNNRWEPYSIYYAAMIIPVLAYVFVLAQRYFNRSVATWIMLVPFLYKFAVYLIWSVTSVHMYFPLVLFVAAIFYDLIFNILHLRTRYASYFGVIALALGLNAVIGWQSPIIIQTSNALLSLSYAIILGVVTIFCSTRFLEKGEFHRA